MRQKGILTISNPTDNVTFTINALLPSYHNYAINGSFEYDSTWGMWVNGYNTEQHLYGARSFKISNSVSNLANQTVQVYENHIYYGREYVKNTATVTGADMRFELNYNDTHVLVFGTNTGTFSDWTMISGRGVYPATEKTTLRTFIVNPSGGDTYIDGIMLVDLTEKYGAGNEPSKEWCDSNLSYRETYPITVTTTNIIADESNSIGLGLDETVTLTYTADGTSYKVPATIPTITGATGSYNRISDTECQIILSNVTGQISFSISGEIIGYSINVYDAKWIEHGQLRINGEVVQAEKKIYTGVLTFNVNRSVTSSALYNIITVTSGQEDLATSWEGLGWAYSSDKTITQDSTIYIRFDA